MDIFLSYDTDGVSLLALAIRKLGAKFVTWHPGTVYMTNVSNMWILSPATLILLLFPFPYGIF